ncbi:hypothetical protein L596_025878 [Steinernema carpocapsae]|uniref:Uncharacterized protein n=1 Tax=Steinernema carpocapsae TaxID=34508 RepID=A0A4U5M911_STECR|nr:hypothetical protein L596_025878 [Steinernema carpocapsae]
MTVRFQFGTEPKKPNLVKEKPFSSKPCDFRSRTSENLGKQQKPFEIQKLCLFERNGTERRNRTERTKPKEPNRTAISD